MKTEKNIVYIVGFMGSGKSTAGKKLASSMSWSFIDLDRRIEEVARKTIPRIFSEDGEEHFRKTESEVLKSLTDNNSTIISTGGGTPCHGDNMDYMNETGITVYLKLTPEQLVKRLLNSSGERPLIKDIPDEKLPEFIEKKLALREKYYNKAEIIVDGLSLNIELLRSIIYSKSASR
ncbi:MAG TPA: shikimate kinase [Bacteroidales bacterium]|nr:shikimate kinase [Bacteroidales bacterium]